MGGELTEVKMLPTEQILRGEMPTRYKNATKYSMVSQAIHSKMDIVRVNKTGLYYYRRPGHKTYDLLDDHTLDVWVRDLYCEGFGPPEPKHLTDCAKMVKMMTKDEVEDMDTGVFQVSEYSFWSTEDGELTRKLPGRCFHKLFDTKVEDKHVVKVEPFSKEQDSKMWRTYEEVLGQLNNGVFEERFNFIKIWADGSHDVYMDIMRSVAYCFIKKKPVGSYVLVGLRRNGKSSFVGMLHTIFGRENTSTVRLSELGDPHYVHSLKTTMLNAPDEEDERAVSAQANFKTLADHGVLTLGVMRSNVPISVVCDFMSFFPMNHIPEWTGTGAAACMKRSLIIPFYADLSEFDKKNFNFAKETFTADMMCEFLGAVFAYANYYSRHELDFSNTMLDEQESLEEEVDSAVTYRKEFERYFDGFESVKLIYQDYCNWCKANDLTISPRKEFKFVFRDYCKNRVSWRVSSKSDDIMSIYRIPKPRHHVLYKGFKCDEVGSVEKLHEFEASIVNKLTVYYVAGASR